MIKLRETKGFTVVELLVVTAVAVILVLAAAPSFTQILDAQQMRSVSERLALNFKQTRLEAIRQNKEIYIHNLNMDSPNVGSWCVLVTESAGTPASCAVTQVIRRLDGERFPRITAYTTVSALRLDPARAIVGSGMSYVLKRQDMADDESVQVVISGKSRVTICAKGGVSGYEAC